MMDLVDDDDDDDDVNEGAAKQVLPATKTNQMAFIRYYFYIQAKNV